MVVIEELDAEPQPDAPTPAALKERGNALFAAGEYEDAIACYLEAVRLSPSDAHDVAVFKANIAACYVKLQSYADAVDYCTQALAVNPAYVKALVRRAQAREKLAGDDSALEHLSAALDDYKRAAELEPANLVATQGAARLTPRVDAERERQKAEMLGKLKDLGNMVLNKFGLSTDNFKFEKDPNTGSYSVNFVQNTPAGASGPA